MSKRWANGSTWAWRKVRKLVLVRDRYRCRLQIPGVCTTIATHVHHTQPREVVGDDPAHLVAACAACNYRVGDPTTAEPDPDPTPVGWWE